VVFDFMALAFECVCAKKTSLNLISSRLTQTQQQLFHDKSELMLFFSSMVEGVIVIASTRKFFM